MGLFWIGTPSCIGIARSVLIPDLMGLFWIGSGSGDGAGYGVLIPDLMGLFWIKTVVVQYTDVQGLNPRFDGAFLNLHDLGQDCIAYES